jgi:hypothetical protein
MLFLAGLAVVVLGVSLVLPGLPFFLTAFASLWCLEYAIGLFVGHPGPDPLVPAMAAGLYLVIELGELTAAAATGAVFSQDVLTARVTNLAMVAGGGVVLSAACLAASGLIRAGGLLGVVVATLCAALVLGIPTVRGRRVVRRR